MCVGQIVGCEAAVHLVRERLQEPDTEAILLVDASNASMPSIGHMLFTM